MFWILYNMYIFKHFKTKLCIKRQRLGKKLKYLLFSKVLRIREHDGIKAAENRRGLKRARENPIDGKKNNQKCMIYLIKHASLYKHICQVLQSYYSLLCSKEVMQEEALYRCKRYMHFWKYDKLNEKKICHINTFKLIYFLPH